MLLKPGWFAEILRDTVFVCSPKPKEGQFLKQWNSSQEDFYDSENREYPEIFYKNFEKLEG